MVIVLILYAEFWLPSEESRMPRHALKPGTAESMAVCNGRITAAGNGGARAFLSLEKIWTLNSISLTTSRPHNRNSPSLFPTSVFLSSFII